MFDRLNAAGKKITVKTFNPFFSYLWLINSSLP